MRRAMMFPRRSGKTAAMKEIEEISHVLPGTDVMNVKNVKCAAFQDEPTGQSLIVVHLTGTSAVNEQPLSYRFLANYQDCYLFAQMIMDTAELIPEEYR
jgi:hypothetical protein